ncbi:hypothetical protein FA15DRAFT_673379 [Coprinopsis marcescibilis]|uniref:Uncharacterized protein n=1 Tax=Coprinopsis marcescibilis TaxID=230819 RepID=A0A5C3KKA1_COPMA|nr:hypothetical protein FA15DRAFT_673379 [Coprinopsis marcescibilis]
MISVSPVSHGVLKSRPSMGPVMGVVHFYPCMWVAFWRIIVARDTIVMHGKTDFAEYASVHDPRYPHPGGRQVAELTRRLEMSQLAKEPRPYVLLQRQYGQG